MFEPVTEENLALAARIHGDSWRESHRAFCSEDFVQAHTTARQLDYIRGEIARGRAFYLLITDSPKGLVSVCGDLIENLYVLPGEQRKGYGTLLLRYAESLCPERTRLWVLSNNLAARGLYRKAGYTFTGRENVLTPSLRELEMARQPDPLKRAAP